jgi:two-component system C4-dicarboxylate transport sensor histidine kinase DctB
MKSVLLSKRYRPLMAAACCLLAASLLIVAISARWIDVSARQKTDVTAAEQAETQARMLAGELQKFRLLPIALSEYPDLHAVLDRGGPAAVARLNDKLKLLADRTDAAAIYVVGRDGVALASSNWNEPGSFVGINFSFRPYFRNAMASGEAELFAVGSVTGRPGLFIARRINEGARILGLIVVKIDFAPLEAQWSRETGRTIVVDPHGVVIITGYGPWRFRSTRPVSASEQAELHSTMLFGSFKLPLLNLHADRTGDVSVPGSDDKYRAATTRTVLRGDRLTHLEPLAPARVAVAANVRLLALEGLGVATMIFAIFWRSHMRRLAQSDSRQVLEAEVSLRTAELQAANSRLRSESERRLEADARWREAREELEQANRLAVIGQITAGIAHEISQPVAAIRAFAENARRHLERHNGPRVDSKLADIVALTDRIGRITTELRNFARRGVPVVREAPLYAAIDGAILLIADRIRADGVTLEWTKQRTEVAVVADRMRLEQILINLIQNALDALEGAVAPRIAILIDLGESVSVTVADNGPGISESMTGKLFTPFSTSKADGLGLGLGIAQDIAREFGGALNLVASPLGGAAFRLTLRRPT